MKTFNSLISFFSEEFEELSCNIETRAYITSIFSRASDFDLSKESLTLLFAKARNEHNFSIYQNIGDWIFYCKSLNPEHLHFASEDYYYSLGRLSYYSCYKLLNRKWKIYDEMAENFILLEKETSKILKRQTVKPNSIIF